MHPRPYPVGPGQESVWDYPARRRPDVSPTRVVVESGGRVVADGVLERASGSSWCEWEGAATYRDAVVDGRRVEAPGWSYEDPTPGFAHLRGAVAFYPGRVDRVTVDGEQVRAQAGGFYGGWITDEVVGPFTGEPGTLGW